MNWNTSEVMWMFPYMEKSLPFSLQQILYSQGSSLKLTLTVQFVCGPIYVGVFPAVLYNHQEAIYFTICLYTY